MYKVEMVQTISRNKLQFNYQFRKTEDRLNQSKNYHAHYRINVETKLKLLKQKKVVSCVKGRDDLQKAKAGCQSDPQYF